MPEPQRVVSFGECMLELQGIAFGAMQQGYGGDTLNTAVYLARCGRAQGLQVDYATALGDDALSSGLLQRWQSEGIGTGLVQRLPGRLPGLYMIDVDEHGERSFSYWRDQSAARSYFDAPAGSTPLETAIDSIDLLYISGISLAILPEAGRQRLLTVAASVRARGAAVAFDNNYRPRLWASATEAQTWFVRCMDVASIALLTLDDAMALASQPDASIQLALSLGHQCPEVVIKRGAQPTVVRAAGEAPVEVATDPVAHIVDTTAAGDAFAGAYLAARLRDVPAAQAAAAGNRLAARVIQYRGAIIPADAMTTG